MPERADDAGRLNGSRICEITGVNRQTRDKWASNGLLRRADAYDQLDVVELVVLKLLLATLRKNHARIAWNHIRPRLRDVVPGPQLTLVWDAERRSADLAVDPDSVVSLVRHGRPVQVLDLGTAVESARMSFRRETQASRTAGGSELKRRRARTQQRHRL